MNRKLLLLTMWFPYGPGEEFLETEIEYLSTAFDSLYVLPTSFLGSKRSTLRTMPDNVELLTKELTVIQAQYTRSRFRRALNWLRDPTFRQCLCQDFRLITSHGWKAFQQLLGFLSSSFIVIEALQTSPKLSGVLLVYSYWLSAGTLAAITLREAGYPFKVVARAHGWDLYAERHQPPYLPLQSYLVHNVDRLFPVSEHGLLYLQNRYPAAADRLVTNRLGVRKAVALSRPSRDERLHVVTCSSMTPVKRLDLWVSALVRCRVPLLWTHIGSGPEEEKIRNLCVSLPGHVQSRFLGRMRNKEVLCYYATNGVDLFANVSESEGLPVAIMEALSYGIPVAATLAGGTGELVSEDNGIVWPIDVSPEGIATDLEKYASLPTDVQERMRKAAVATWESKVSANKQYSRFAELLDDVLGPVG